MRFLSSEVELSLAVESATNEKIVAHFKGNEVISVTVLLASGLWIMSVVLPKDREC
jgi:hypothetical protein